MLASSLPQKKPIKQPGPGDVIDCLHCRGTGRQILATEHDCPRCNGTGEVTIGKARCPVCGGTGRPFGSVASCRCCQSSGWIKKVL